MTVPVLFYEFGVGNEDYVVHRLPENIPFFLEDTDYSEAAIFEVYLFVDGVFVGKECLDDSVSENNDGASKFDIGLGE